MRIQTTQLKLHSPVTPEKMFKGFVLDVDDIVKKVAPKAFKDVDIIGDGGPGTLKHCILGDNSPHTTMMIRIDALDKQALTSGNSIISGDVLLGIIYKIENELKFKPAFGGGCNFKAISTYHTKGDAVVPQENIMFADVQRTQLFRAVEAYLK